MMKRALLALAIVAIASAASLTLKANADQIDLNKIVTTGSTKTTLPVTQDCAWFREGVQ